MPRIDLVTPYREYFKLAPADTDSLKEIVYKIRYDVYCDELGWEDPNLFPNRQEQDTFDASSKHCLLLHRGTNIYAGCVRLVLAIPDRDQPAIPLQKHCAESLDITQMDIDQLPRSAFGEISRLAIISEYRRRPAEEKTPDGMGTDLFQMKQDERRRFPHIALGLYLGAASIGLGSGLDGVFAMMEPRLARHLRLVGIQFLQVGKVIDHHGPRAPFYITRAGLFDKLRPELRDLLEAIEEDLQIAHSTKFA